jgi:hypothetical protein
LTGSEDLSETRNLVEEINMRTKQLPLTKQDSYANAIYNSATRAQQGGFHLLDLIIPELKSHMTC